MYLEWEDRFGDLGRSMHPSEYWALRAGGAWGRLPRFRRALPWLPLLGVLLTACAPGASAPGVSAPSVSSSGPSPSGDQDRDWPVLTEYRSLFGGLFRRMYGLDDTRLETVLPRVRAQDIGLV